MDCPACSKLSRPNHRLYRGVTSGARHGHRLHPIPFNFNCNSWDWSPIKDRLNLPLADFPEAFLRPVGYIDAYVKYRSLSSSRSGEAQNTRRAWQFRVLDWKLF